jgi:hypothetical protein
MTGEPHDLKADAGDPAVLGHLGAGDPFLF